MGKQLPQFRAQYKNRLLRLQERDLKIIKKVYEYRFLDSDQLRALFSDQVKEPVVRGEKTDEAITRRLQKLFHHGYLDRPKSQIKLRIRYGNLPLIYALGDKGARELAREYGLDIGKINWQVKNSQVKDPYIMHRLMISKVRAILEVALKDRVNTELVRWEDGKELESASVGIRTPSGKRATIRLLPDGLFGLWFRDRREGKNKAHFFLEADRSTMPHGRFFKKKVLGYLEYYGRGEHKKTYGISEFRVLTTTLTKERRDNLREGMRKRLMDRMASSRDRARFLFACEKDYQLGRPESILGKIWFGLDEGRPGSILPQN